MGRKSNQWLFTSIQFNSQGTKQEHHGDNGETRCVEEEPLNHDFFYLNLL